MEKQKSNMLESTYVGRFRPKRIKSGQPNAIKFNHSSNYTMGLNVGYQSKDQISKKKLQLLLSQTSEGIEALKLRCSKFELNQSDLTIIKHFARVKNMKQPRSAANRIRGRQVESPISVSQNQVKSLGDDINIELNKNA